MTLSGHLFSAPLHTEIQMVPVRLIEEPDTQEVNPGIERLGVMQSVLLKLSGHPERPYRIVDGKRRVRSALNYGIEQVPALITDGTRGQIAAASAILNAARSSHPLDEARNWQIALEEGQFGDVKELAAHVRVSVQTIRKRLRLLTLPEDLLAHIGVSIAEGVAERMANLAPRYREQAIRAAECRLDAGERFTAADLEESQTARARDFEQSLDTLFGTEPLLEVPRDPVAELVQEVKRLAALGGIELPGLVRALAREVPGLDEPSPTPAEPPAAPRPSVSPRPGRVNLGLRHSEGLP
ncbi:hypothetical protein DAETH_44600 (plasmid) [Deinococcus aetherius]|uniref:ParB-like N-terminal domain-containing protein n=1 Tax=Deinococcus aetherius TaxID=200252 RepID=A0ABM8AKY0_9DEIO|nr:ParB/RepB/Spo0J family partition protein [Deinococcus aetherius]BDP44491.1 hypothetical protein DAETH_44600 [Deinococcus aetherius]